ncbi:choice-of-anchor Q domain-containing protein [Parabacteroides sp. PF5-6]|uniref:choice-of-anchor Q domain-containing protein n=1 Tax=Parabacteroides sp. PF5-6 TaxID=1742403 RepID=UPI00240766D6|nr:choice-of-anchor Q domain-containing protein [Parabacteroides sp. PF5-6]MDF9831299.1 hypothetical protein [Parabacteroides sp. PF5-6]
MTKKLHLVLTLFLIGVTLSLNAFAEGAEPTKIIRVDQQVSGGAGDGSSWDNAYKELSAALTYAATDDGDAGAEAAPAPIEIWVAAGEYKPTAVTGPITDADRDATFAIPAHVTVYGGFDGGEENRDQRNWVNNQTILSGDLLGDDTAGDLTLNKNDNSYTVVRLTGGTLDGFYITGGKGDGQGGGVYAEGGTLRNNTIYDNNSASSGGGVYAINGATLTNNTIYGNKAGYGGGVYAYGDVTLTNNTIYGNTVYIGGGVHAYGDATLTNNTIYGNTASSDGGGVFAYGDATLTNNILWENKLTAGGIQDLYVSSSGSSSGSGSHNLIGSEIAGDGSFSGDNPLIGSTYDPLFADAANGDFRLLEGSPAIDAGDNDAYKGKGYPDTDAAGDKRIQGTINIGAYETVVPTNADPATYHSLTLELAPGIDLYNYTAGTHSIAEGDHLFLQFLPEDPTLTAEDLMLVIDGVDTPFTVPAAGSYYSYILNPVTADHTILIAQREYTVTLPETEGITYNVGAGAHKVAYGAPFSFTLTGDFDPAQIHVYHNGQEISPSNLPEGEALRSEALPISSPLGGGRVGASLSYTIDRVTGPITITLEGTSPTSNTSLTQGIRLAIDNGQLTIDNEMATAVDVAVYNVTGQNVVQLRGLRGSKTVALAAGIYFVRAGNQRWKVMVND